MSNENHSQFENFLAQAAKPTEIEVEQIELPNDPEKSLNRGLITLYNKYISDINSQRQAGLIDRESADELTNGVLALAEKDGLGNEIGYTPTERAKEIMGLNLFFGPDEVRKAGIEIREEIPPIPFNPNELERAKELGQMLIYRTSTTMKELNDTIGPKLKADGKGDLLSNNTYNKWYAEEDFYKIEKIQPGWALVSKYHTPGTTNKNYFQQSELLAEYLVNEVFQGRPLPQKYQEAINQLDADRETIQQLIDSNIFHKREKAGQMSVDLRINQLFRQSPAEVIYDCLVYLQNTGERIHDWSTIWTNAENFDGAPVYVGRADKEGAHVYSNYHFTPLGVLGASFARRSGDLKS